MMRYTYLISLLPLFVLWFRLYTWRKDMRREMLLMSVLLAFLSVITSYYWWSVDWWRPMTVTGTRVGVEDFLLGFGSGGIMAVVYEVIAGRRCSKRRARSHGWYGFFVVLLFLGCLTAWLFYGVGLTSFYASTIALLVVAAVMYFIRRDLVVNGLITGLCALLLSVLCYATILLISPGWVDATYRFSTLSGARIIGVPLEEFVFWFFAGLVFGPFYEFWKGIRLRRMTYAVHTRNHNR